MSDVVVTEADRLAALLALAYAEPPATERVIADVARAIAAGRREGARDMRERAVATAKRNNCCHVNGRQYSPIADAIAALDEAQPVKEGT